MKYSVAVSILISVLVIGCHKSSTDPGAPAEQLNSYPTGIGSSWFYQHTMHMENFRPSFPGATFTPDTIQGTATVAVTRLVRLPSGSGPLGDSIQTSEFQRTEVTTLPYPSTSIGYQYYSSDSSGLYVHGYRGGGGMAAPVAIPEGPHLVLNGMRFRSIRELADAVLLRTNQADADTVQREIPPRKAIQFPLTIGKSWVYLAANPWHIEKTVVSDTTLFIGGISFHCYKVRWIYDMDNNGVPDQNIWIDDYIAQEGLLRRTTNFKDIMISTTENPDGIGTVDGRDEYIGTSVLVR